MYTVSCKASHEASHTSKSLQDKYLARLMAHRRNMHHLLHLIQYQVHLQGAHEEQKLFWWHLKLQVPRMGSPGSSWKYWTKATWATGTPLPSSAVIRDLTPARSWWSTKAQSTRGWGFTLVISGTGLLFLLPTLNQHMSWQHWSNMFVCNGCGKK